MTLDKRDVDRLRSALNTVADIPAGYGRLGRGDQSGIIVANLAQRRIYYFDGPTNQPTATAKLAQNISISSVNNASLEGTRIRLGYPSYEPKVLYMIGFDSGEGMDSVGGATPQEQQENKALYPDVGSIQNLRIIAQETPDTSVFVNPTPYYDADGIWRTFGGDADDWATEMAALSSGNHQMGVVCLDVTTGDLVHVTNTEVVGGVADKNVFDWTTIEDMVLSADYIPAGAVHLYYGQTVIVEADIYRSSDPRAIFGKMGGGGGSTTFSVSADTGTPATIGDGETLAVVGGTAISTDIDDVTKTLTIAVIYEAIQDMIAAFLAPGANISITYSDVGDSLTIAVTGLDSGDISDFSEAVDDRVAALLVAGANINLTYSDVGNTLTIAVTGLTSAQISDFSEAVDDRVNALLVAGYGIVKTYDDSGNTLTLSAPDILRTPCRVVSLANVSVSSAPASIDSITLASGNRVLLTAQSTASQNGIWIFNGAGNAMTRPADFASGSTILAFYGVTVEVLEGTTYKGAFVYIDSTAAITIDTTTISWSFVAGAFLSLGLIGLGVGRFNVNSLTADRNWGMPDASGTVLLDTTIVPTIPDIVAFGDGSDGDVTVSGALALTRDMYYHNLTISAGAAITPVGYRIFVSGTLDISAAPASWIVANGNNASAATGGTASASVNIGGGAAGANAPAGANSTGIAGTPGDTGGNGGNGGRSGNVATTGGTTTATGNAIKRWAVDLLKGAAVLLGGSGGTSGTTGTSNVSGGGGGGGGIIYIAAKTIARGTSTQANGAVANGGTGGNGVNAALANGSGGGGGGGGGWIFIIYKTLTGSSITSHFQANGGTGGNGGTVSTTGGTGGTGGSGGRVTKINMLTGVLTETVGGAGSAGSANSGATGGAGGAGASFQANL